MIVTSGTAAANLYPAIVEARQTGVNLIILTADRPPELWECGANQAIVQQNMFADYPVASVNLPKPQADYAAKWLISTLEQACYKQNNNQAWCISMCLLQSHFIMRKNKEIDKPSLVNANSTLVKSA